MRPPRILILAAVVAVAVLLAGCRGTPRQREARFLKTGFELNAKHDYPRALLSFLNAAQAMPADAEPHYQLGLVYLQMSNWASAVSEFRRATALNPRHWQANLKLAELMAATRNHALLEDAAARIHKVLSESPDNPEAADALAMTEIQRGDPSAAAAQLEETLEKLPAHLHSSVMLARLKLAKKDYAAAEEVLLRAAAAAPQSAAATLALGQLYLSIGRYEKAEALARKALALDTHSEEALWTLAASQTARGQSDRADRTYQLLAALPNRHLRAVHALFLFQAGKREAALAEFERAYRKFKDDRGLRTQLVAACLEMNKTAEAGSLLAEALERNPKDTDALFQRSELALRTGNALDAQRDLKEVLGFQPNSALAHYLLAIVSRSLGFEESARAELSEALNLDRRLLAARLELAADFRRAHQPKAAIAVLDEAPPAQQRILGVVVERNWILLQQGDIQSVRQTLDRLLPGNKPPELVLQDAAVKLAQHDYSGARASAEEVLRSNPGEVRAARLVAQTYAARNQAPQALERLQQLAAARPQSGPLQELLGQWYLSSGRLPEARAAFEAARKDEAGSSSPELALAEVDWQEKHFDAALDRVNRIVAAEPRNLTAALLLAGFHSESGDRQSAIAEYQSALKIDGSNVIALNNLAYLTAQQDPGEALKLAEEAAVISPGNPAIEDTLGWVYYRQGNYRLATTHLKAAFEKEPSPRYQFHLGMSYMKSGDSSAGAKLLDSALHKDPNLPRTEVGW